MNLMYLNIFLFVTNFVRTLLVIFLIYLVIRIFSRYILPFLVEKGVKNIQQKMENQYRENQRQGRNEGEVTVEGKRRDTSGKQSNEGEYVDFEEVD